MREPRTYKGLVRAMNRGNVSRSREPITFSYPDFMNEGTARRAENYAIRKTEVLIDKYRRGDLTVEGLANTNNKLTLVAHHIPTALLPISYNPTIEDLAEETGIRPEEVLGEYKKGGMVKKTGYYKLHKGEKVIPANEVKKNKTKYKK